jgi:hypothetical protein
LVSEQETLTDSESTLAFLKPLDSRTREWAVLDALAKMIEAAGLGMGDKLPPEVRLAQSWASAGRPCERL